MNTIYRFLLLFFLLFVSLAVFAQAQYDVSGIVTNEKGEPIKGATVFIGGSERIMATGDDGRFKFAAVPPGTFQLSAHFLGYNPLTRNIIVKTGPVNVDMQLEVKSIALAGVQIGKKSAWADNFRLFKETFLGTSANAKQCVIVNPKVINFSTKKGLLLADADDFLIIENKRLGYRLHYQLGDFGYSTTGDLALYHGECTFEEMAGTDEQKKQWSKNRLETYQGSLTHFLRSVYANKVLENGFITRPMYSYGPDAYNPDKEDRDKVIINDRQVMFDSLVTTIDTSFKALKFNQLYVIYDPRKAQNYFADRNNNKKTIVVDNNSTILRLATSEAMIDKRGSHTDYSDFYIHGNWAKARVADQLPVEYQPPFVPMAQKDYPTDKLAASLQKWTDSIPQEKIYLHMDKPCYARNDTIWFKGYLTVGSRHELSALSGAAYVDLINEKNELISELKLPVDSGKIAGNFIAGDNLKDGRYHIRAYTRWMRNAGEDYYFDHTFNIGNPVKEKDIPNNQQQTDVQFFPEGGILVNGLVSRVGFKAVGVNGLGEIISGKITDNDHKEVADIITLHAGMGSFSLRPVAGQTYMANINFANGTTKSVALPSAINEGYVLNVYQPNKDSILVRIRASAGLKASTVYLVIHSSGEVISASPVVINSAMSSVWLDKKLFPGGIAQFTLFNTNYEPLNERIAFIKSNDLVKMTVKADKSQYKSKDHVQLNLSVNDNQGRPSSGNFSVAVIDQNRVPVNENTESTIFSNILLKSDLKGYIENPNYYFTADTDTVNTALDNLMLTQGYRRFEWKLLDNIVKVKPLFAAEGLTSVISGQVTSLSHKPSPNAKVMITSLRAKFTRDTVTDVNGKFKFDRMFIGDSLKFAVQARDAEGSDKVILTVDSLPQINLNGNNASITTVANTSGVKFSQVSNNEINQAIAQIKGNTLLNQVNVKAKEITKVNKDISPQETFKVPEQSADKVITIPDPQNYVSLTMALQARLPGIMIDVDENGYKELINLRPPDDLLQTTPGTKKSDNRQIGLIVNGRKISSKGEVDEILEGSILPEDIAKIEIVRTNRAMMSYLHSGDEPGAGYSGYVLLFTKLPTARKQYNPNIVNITPKGFNKARRFYSPHYDHPESADNKPDLRTTIYWNPYLKVDSTGKIAFDFYNADGPATYRVVVEGINKTGELGRQVYTYKVE